MNLVLKKRLPGEGWVRVHEARVCSGGGRRVLRSPGFQSLVGFGAFSVLKRAINDFLKQENNLKLLFFPETICSLPLKTPQTVVHQGR